MKAKARILMSLKIWLVIYPSITLFLFLFGQQLSSLPLYQKTFILTISLVSLDDVRWSTIRGFTNAKTVS